MIEFRVGDRVRAIEGVARGEEGVVKSVINRIWEKDDIRVKFDSGVEYIKVPGFLELLEVEEGHVSFGSSYYLAHCGLCGSDYPVSTDPQVTTMFCRCGAEIVFSKNEEGYITVRTIDWED